jgi:hypothetical protein
MLQCFEIDQQVAAVRSAPAPIKALKDGDLQRVARGIVVAQAIAGDVDEVPTLRTAFGAIADALEVLQRHLIHVYVKP